MRETRARGAAPSPPRKLPMMAHLEPGLGLAIGAIFGLLVALINPLGQGWSVHYLSRGTSHAVPQESL